MTKHSKYLQTLGREILATHAKVPGVMCAALIGSSVEGHSDDFSDLDMAIYYSAMPAPQQVQTARETIKDAGPIIWTIGDENEGEYAHAFKLNGIECQISHVTVSKWEADIDRILKGEEPASPLHKAMSGTLVAIPVVGEALMDKWKAQIRNYPDELAIAMVKHHLKFFPMWSMYERFDRRDANLWIRQSMVESSFNILGALSGLNRKFFTPFQFKRARLFIDSLEIAPLKLAQRLDDLWTTDLAIALTELKNLAIETVELIEREMPAIDATAARKMIGREDVPWQVPM